MAESPSHTFGQIIGELLEAALADPLAKIAKDHRLYLDYKHRRPARSGKVKVAWKDSKGNVHDLDYVMEFQGSEAKIGLPKAFIEIAWRRYTKHSRNKAQEIQGAIIPLAESYAQCRPFLGVVLAGDFTSGSLAQLRSHGFHVLYYPYETVIAAFDVVGIDASFDEDTSDAKMRSKVAACHQLSKKSKNLLVAAFRKLRKAELGTFLRSLSETLSRKLQLIRVLPLHGSFSEFSTISGAIRFIKTFDDSKPGQAFIRYDVIARYSNGDEVRGEFEQKLTAIGFLGNL